MYKRTIFLVFILCMLICPLTIQSQTKSDSSIFGTYYQVMFASVRSIKLYPDYTYYYNGDSGTFKFENNIAKLTSLLDTSELAARARGKHSREFLDSPQGHTGEQLVVKPPRIFYYYRSSDIDTSGYYEKGGRGQLPDLLSKRTKLYRKDGQISSDMEFKDVDGVWKPYNGVVYLYNEKSQLRKIKCYKDGIVEKDSLIAK